MARRQSLAILAYLLSLLGTSVRADDLILPSFAGPYLGGTVGYASQKVDVDNLTLGTSFSDESGDVTFGGYAGYRWQFCGHFRLGIEAGVNYLDGSATAFDIEVGPTNLTETTSLRSKIGWFGTLLGQAGVVVHRDFLLYATGGLAYARVKHTLRDDCVGCGNTPFNLGAFAQTDKDTKTGWVAGGGVEYAHYQNWLLRAEAFYVDLGSSGHTYVIETPIATGTAATKWFDEFWVARIGLGYQFVAP